MKVPCSCAPFPRSAALYIHYFTTDQTHLTACASALPSCCLGFSNLFIYLLRFLCTWLVVLVKVSEWSHKGEFSGKEPSSSSLHAADLVMRVAQRRCRGFKAKSQVIFHLIFEPRLPSIQAIPCKRELNRN